MTRKTKSKSKTKKPVINDEPFEIVHGSGNIFRDLNLPNPDYEQLRAILAGQIVSVLDERKLTVREAHKLTGFAASDFSRIRNCKLDRFTIDRLMFIIDALGQRIDIAMRIHPKKDGTYAHHAGVV